MSSSSYCQGLQSCLEPSCTVEPRVLRLTLAWSKSEIYRSWTARKSIFSDGSDCDGKSSKKIDMGGWSFLQSMTNNESKEKDKIYVPPNCEKPCNATLSEKSLDMCTESLGSETGGDMSESSDEMALVSSDNENYEVDRQRSKVRGRRSRMSGSGSGSFPPPLTSIRGARMRPHREEGRLILEAVQVSCCNAYFQAERSHGRLRLHLLNPARYYSENEEEQQEKVEEFENEMEMSALEEVQ